MFLELLLPQDDWHFSEKCFFITLTVGKTVKVVK